MNERWCLCIREELNEATGVNQNLFVSRNSEMSLGSAVFHCESVLVYLEVAKTVPLVNAAASASDRTVTE